MAEILDTVDVGDWDGLEPDELLADPRLVQHPALEAAGRALRYARADPAARYDEIAFRLRAATPAHLGQVPFATFGSVRREHASATRRHTDPVLERIRSEQVALRHRPIDFPGEGHIEYRIEGDLIILLSRDDRGATERWTFALSHPPQALDFGAVDDDAPLLASQRLAVDLPGARWLPVPMLVAAGRFRRMQDWADDLLTGTAPGWLFAFVSHRWLTPAHPDPDGLQAQYVAWQLVAYLCEAIDVAARRGLETPRRRSAVGPHIGATGSDLAESIVVNVLRPALDDATLMAAHAEIESLGDAVASHGVPAALEDAGLARLRDVLGERPVLSALLGRVAVWYDYSCMPQPPRTTEEDELFRLGLEALNPCQMLGTTLVVLDEAEDYLRRAWCTMEGILADQVGGMDVLVGSNRPTAAEGRTEAYFASLLWDRPHLVWRALLDTEVFGIQSVTDCMDRLSLGATRPADVPFIYGRLLGLGMPRRIHVDGSEIVTGTLPLPDVGDGRVLTAGAGRSVAEAEPASVASLDWTQALRADAVGDETEWPPSWVVVPGDDDAEGDDVNRATGAHVAVLGSCEGEAVLLSRWVLDHLQDLESVFAGQTASVSWTASDIAPVGHLAEGALRVRAVDASLWILVGSDLQLARAEVSGLVSAAAAARGALVVQVAVDRSEANVVVQAPVDPKTLGRLVATGIDASRAIPGGLFRSTLVDVLTPTAADD